MQFASDGVVGAGGVGFGVVGFGVVGFGMITPAHASEERAKKDMQCKSNQNMYAYTMVPN